MANERLGISASAAAPASGRLRETTPTSSWAKSRERLAWLFCAPAVIAVLIVAIYPLFRTVYLSFTNANISIARETSWVGLRNYERLWNDDQWWESLLNTVVFTVASVGFETLLGIIIALTIHSNFKGRGLVRTSMLVPWAIPTIVSAQMWKWMYHDVFGVVNDFFGVKLGIMNPDTALLANPTTALFAIVAVDIWKTTPFMALLILAGLQVIPGDIYESSNIDGASKVRQFFDMTLPLLKPALLVALIFRTMDAFRVFDVIYVMSGNNTDTMSVAIYTQQTIFQEFFLGRGSAAAVVIFLIIAAFVIVYTRLVRVEEMG
jgi:trehalose/maltose transport system permease protein